MHDSFGAAVFDFIKSPLKNYHKYRSLYKLEDIENSDEDDIAEDIIWALRDVSFDVKQGEVLGIIGRNGAGKSTLLKILCKITDPTSGFAEIKGRVSSLLEVRTGFHQELTGRENIYLNDTILGMTKKEVDRKFDEIIDFSGVEKFFDTPPKRYSKCLRKMEDVGQEGRTVLFVSHNMPAITRLCQRAILLHEGRIMEDGLADQVVSNYLTSDLGTTAAREWPNPEKAPTGTVAWLRAVRVKTEEGTISETFDIRKPIIFEMKYEVLKPYYVLLPHFSLSNDFGELAFISLDLDPAWRRRGRPVGNYSSKAVIPGNFLSEGLMYISCHCLALAADTVEFSERKVIAFHVKDGIDGNSARGDYSKKMRGVVRPILDWGTHYTPETHPDS